MRFAKPAVKPSPKILRRIPAISAHPVIVSNVVGHVGVLGGGAGPPRGTNLTTAKKFAPQRPIEMIKAVAKIAIALA